MKPQLAKDGNPYSDLKVRQDLLDNSKSVSKSHQNLKMALGK